MTRIGREPNSRGPEQRRYARRAKNGHSRTPQTPWNPMSPTDPMERGGTRTRDVKIVSVGPWNRRASRPEAAGSVGAGRLDGVAHLPLRVSLPVSAAGLGASHRGQCAGQPPVRASSALGLKVTRYLLAGVLRLA